MTRRNKDKQLKKTEYKQNPPVMGVFLIRNIVNERILVESGLNLSGIINRHKFQLASGIHPNTKLQQDWNEFGSDKFEFEIVDQLEALPEKETGCRADLDSLTELWLEKLKPFGESGYNERKASKAELLRRIAKKHSHD